jgi:mannose-6-phosphate isomerase-like protein (cupin superfamily)
MSLTALQRVAEKLDMSIDELLAAPPTANGGKREKQRVKLEVFDGITPLPKPVKLGRGALYQFLGEGKGHMIHPYVLTIQPGAGFTADPVSHAGEEFAYVAFGDVQFVLGKTKHRLRQGDSVRFYADTPHAFENLSTSGVALVIGAATPPW